MRDIVKWLLTVEANYNDVACQPKFNEWYDKIHLPDSPHRTGQEGDNLRESRQYHYTY